MTIFLPTILLAQMRMAGAVPTVILVVWSAACLAGLAGVACSCFRAGRKPALALAYLSIGCVVVLVLWVLSRNNWSLWTLVVATERMWIRTAMILLLIGTPCSVGMLLILYHNQKDRPARPSEQAPPPPPQGPTHSRDAGVPPS